MAQVQAALMARAAQGGGQPGQGGDSSGGGGDDSGSAYAQQVSDLKGADPGMLLRQVQQIQKIMAVMAVQNMERLPNVASKIMKVVPQFDAIVKEIQSASAVDKAVRPIQFGAANPTQPDTGSPAPTSF